MPLKLQNPGGKKCKNTVKDQLLEGVDRRELFFGKKVLFSASL